MGYGNPAPKSDSAVWRCAAALVAILVMGWAASGRAEQSGAPASVAQAAPKAAQIDRNGVLILIRSTLLALHQADETGNYTVLRDLSAPGFQQANNAARLAEIFANLRAQKLDLSGVAVLDPQLTLLPEIESNGMMHMAGFFPSMPVQINFELWYAPVDGRWRPFGISVGVGSSSPAAPIAAQQTPVAVAGEPSKRQPDQTRPKKPAPH